MDIFIFWVNTILESLVFVIGLLKQKSSFCFFIVLQDFTNFFKNILSNVSVSFTETFSKTLKMVSVKDTETFDKILKKIFVKSGRTIKK